MDPQVKGNQIILTKKYFLQRFGPEALDRVFNAMSSKNRAIVQKPLVSGGWEPEEAYVEFLAQADKTLGTGDYQLDWDCGRFRAKESVPTIYKIFIKFGDPGFVIERAGRFWHQIHSAGELETTRNDKTSVTGRLTKDFPHKAFCCSLAGYFQGTLELCGARDVKIEEVKCAATGDKYCEYLATWK